MGHLEKVAVDQADRSVREFYGEQLGARGAALTSADIAADKDAVRRLSNAVLVISQQAALTPITEEACHRLLEAGLLLRHLAGMPMPWDDPQQRGATHKECCVESPWNSEVFYLAGDEAARYEADPDLFCAKHFGLETAEQYREWIQAGGAPLCSERTQAGRPCRNITGHVQMDAAKWKSRHRATPCRVHGGK